MFSKAFFSTNKLEDSGKSEDGYKKGELEFTEFLLCAKHFNIFLISLLP